jgi:hypothetical protein
MIVRARSNLSLAAALSESDVNAVALLEEHRQKMHGFIVKYRKAWQAIIVTAVAFAAAAGVVMLSAIVHGAWIALHARATHP